MAFNKNDKADGAKVRRGGAVRRRKKVCVFCGEKNGEIDYNCLLYTSDAADD